MVTQVAIEAEDPAVRERTYLLRRDGVWIEHVTHALLEDNQRVKVAFDSMAEIGRLMDTLNNKPEVIAEREIDQTKLTMFLAKVEAEGGMLAHIKANVRIYKGS